MNSNIEVRKELSITASLNFFSICSNIVFINFSLNNGSIFLRILNICNIKPSWIFRLNNFCEISSTEDFNAFGCFLNIVSSNNNILIWICGEDVSNKDKIGFFNSLIAPSNFKCNSLLS